jgi:hypothetical protein
VPAAPAAAAAPRPAQGATVNEVVRARAVPARALASLPADGQELVKQFDSQNDAILKEVQQKIESNREAAIKALQDLQDKYTKAGKLDEAVAIRDYLRAGGPGQGGRLFLQGGTPGYVIRR